MSANTFDAFVKREEQFILESREFKSGDYVMLRSESRHLRWSDWFITRNGCGPFVILRVSDRPQPIIVLAHPGSTIPLLHREDAIVDVSHPSSWIFGKFFRREPFLGAVALACHKAENSSSS